MNQKPCFYIKLSKIKKSKKNAKLKGDNALN